MDYQVSLIQRFDPDTDGIGSQVLKDEKDHTLFHVCNLCDCPEDARINRDLFNVHDYIAAVQFGIQLANQGYQNIVISEVMNI